MNITACDMRTLDFLLYNLYFYYKIGDIDYITTMHLNLSFF